jgi:predicted phage tail protein
VDDLTSGRQQTIRVQNVPGTSYIAAAPLLVGHSYQWWVRAVTAGGMSSLWSSASVFTEVAAGTPAPIGPVSTGPRDATFLWKAAAGADHYDLWVDDLTTGQSQVIRNQTIAGTSFQPAGLLRLGDAYRWWVRAINASGAAGSWSPASDFAVVAFPAPSLISAAGPAAAPTFTWTAVAAANHYDLWVDDLTSGQSQVVRATNIAGTSFLSGPLTPGHIYRWWVRAIDNAGTASPWSASLDFTAT